LVVYSLNKIAAFLYCIVIEREREKRKREREREKKQRIGLPIGLEVTSSIGLPSSDAL
jgi:hypothetical protein